VTQPPTIEVPIQQNILQYTAEFLLKEYGSQAPDFSNCFVLLPQSQIAQQFNAALCYSLPSQLNAIIPPWSGTLKAWAKQFASSQHSDYLVIGEHARQLLFIEALQQHPDLFKEENQWQVTQVLLNFFDELSLNQKDLFTSTDKWQQQLQQAYGIEDQHEHMLYESRLVYTLWHAWQQQLSENQLYDETSDYLSRLANAGSVINKQQQFICLGLSQYSIVEQNFIKHLINNNQCHVIEIEKTLVADTHSSGNPFATFIREAFTQSSSQSIKQRAQSYADKFPENILDKIPFSTYLAGDEEEQIRAIDYFIRLNLLDGKNNIAIISEDRKLSRRLRALLERANIQLQDKAGWSLATTQAATIIERWLECIEEDFSAYPLLDCLKSPFINIAEEKNLAEDSTANENFRKNIYRFEHDLIFHENVSSNITQYKDKLKQRLKRLSHWPANSYDELIDTLNFIQKTAKPLSACYSADDTKILLSDFIDTLINSLQQLGVLQNYQNDEAGLVILKTLDELKQSLNFSNPKLSWYDCRIWLGMALESQHFTPPVNNSNVQLMTLEQASHQNFDCIIIAATESQHFPGSANNHPLFNQAVRASLELTTWEQQREQRHELFNRALLSAPEILLTACNEDKGEEKPVSPWLELLVNFYQLAFNKSPENQPLRKLVQSQTEVFNSDTMDLPDEAIKTAMAIPEDLIPEIISASSHQRLINCPYQFFSADGLQLKAREELTDELKKAGYGERIHLILQSFHSGHKKYGKPFSDTLTESNRLQAEQHLSNLSEKIFVSDLENNALHRSWLYRWQKHIPAYINWQIQHQTDWNVYLSEEHIETVLTDSLKIHGRLDRIDSNKENKTHAILDYKTGRTARQEDVDNGENVQLSTYALLDAEASEVSYLSVDSSTQKVESKSSLSGDKLLTNREENKKRLIEMFRQMKNNESLHAWGDEVVCGYCDFSGLCRKSQ